MFIWGWFPPPPPFSSGPRSSQFEFSTVCLINAGVGQRATVAEQGMHRTWGATPSLCVGKGRELDTCVRFDMPLPLLGLLHLKVRSFYIIFALI